jgi:hypothetical protein
LPGGSRIKYVWVDGKPPKYWVILGVAFLVYCAVWILLVVFFWRFARSAPDALHFSSRMYNNKIYYFPSFVMWLHDFGLFIVMGWMFVLAAIMALYRKMVPRDS